MQLEDLKIALRPRRPWEAIDLGLTMVQAWWLRLFVVWVAITLPVFLLINLLVDHPFWSFALMWWLKPLFDRPLLHVLSRAVFGATPSVRETLRSAPGVWRRSGLIWHLTLGRVDFARAFRLPVLQLEGLGGKARRARMRVMSARGGGYGVGLTLVYLSLEVFLYLGLFVLGYMLLPQASDLDPFESLMRDDSASHWLWNTFAYLASTIIEPFYVASGFGLYLNRRTVLEAWDLELDLRRLSARLNALVQGSVKTALMCVVIAGALVTGADSAVAAIKDTPLGKHTADADPQAVIKEVLEHKDFGEERTQTAWRVKDDDEEEDEPVDPFIDPDLLETVAEWLGAIAEGVGWALAAIALIALLVFLFRNAGPLREWSDAWRARRRRLDLPTSIAGLALEPESLPDDIVAGARKLWRDGEPRAALSVLYRGAIIELLTRGMVLPESATEGDVIRRASTRLGDDAQAGLALVVRAWQTLAYAHHLPHADEFEELCVTFARYFVPETPESTST